MSDCVFCKIVKGDLPSYKVDENDNYLAILDISQFTQGHTIVMPKKHFEYVWDINDVESFFAFINKVANSMRKMGFKYVDSMTFGRMVPHAHYHLIPHNGDNSEWNDSLKKIGGMQQDTSRRPSSEQAAIILRKVSPRL